MQFTNTYTIDLFAESVQGYDQIWIIGDAFVRDTHEKFFLNTVLPNGKQDYIATHYDPEICFRSLMDEGNPVDTNVLQRIRNSLVEAINTFVLLPKAILVVVDDNILDDLNHYNTGISSAIGKLMEWLTGEFHQIITSYKDKLPSKSRKFKYPAVLWCLIPLHEIYGHYNKYKGKYNTATIKAAKNYKEMDTLALDLWDTENLSYFEGGEFTPFGLKTYWHAINKAFED